MKLIIEGKADKVLKIKAIIRSFGVTITTVETAEDQVSEAAAEPSEETGDKNKSKLKSKNK